MTDQLDLRAALDAAARDPDTEALVLAIDSPGGMAMGTPETANLVAEIATRMPVVAHTDALMCSAAYWIGAQATGIVATESSTVGSIGTYMAILDESAAYAAAGYKQELFATGPYKAAGLPGLTLTDAQRQRFQARVDEIQAGFVRALAGRGLEPEHMQGQSMSGREALSAGLVDQIGGIDVAFQMAAELLERVNT